MPPGPGPNVSIWPPPGMIRPGTEISLNTQPGAQIYYTLDETPPRPTQSLLYDGAFPLWGASVIRCVAIDAEGRLGPINTVRYELDIFPPRSIISPQGGSQSAPIEISFATEADARVYFTLDGTTPSVDSRLFVKPVTINADTVVRYFAIDTAGNREVAQRAVFHFAPILTVTPESGLYPGPTLEVKVQSNEPALIQYRSLVPPGDWQELSPGQSSIQIERDQRLQIASTDLTGLSTSVIRDYGLIRAQTSAPSTFSWGEVRVMALIDLEGLGQARLLVATKDALYSAARRADGKGWETPQKLLSLSFEAAWIRVWDLDGDGISDLMLGDTTGRLHLFQANSATDLVLANDLLGPWQPGIQSLQVMVPIDIDANGQLDILLLDQRAGSSQILRRTQTGYRLELPITPAIEAGAVGALAGDFGGDGRADLLILPGAERIPYLLQSEGATRFVRQSLEAALVLHPGVRWLHAARADLDHDGDLDLLLVGRGPAPPQDPDQRGPSPFAPGTPVIHVVLLRSLSPSFWQREDALLLADQALRGVTLLDLDADGFDDLVLLPATSGPVLAIKNILGRRLLPLPFGAADRSWPAAIAATAAEIDGSGATSLVLAQAQGELHTSLSLPKEHHFLRLLIQGIRGNRNAIGARVTTQAPPNFRRVREIGIRHTGPDQTELFVPWLFSRKSEIGTLTIRWPDGLQREIPAPVTNQTFIVSPP